MKANYKIAAALIGSFVLGVGAASVLHAQGKPAAYVVAQIDVKDRDGFIKDFLPKTQANMKDFGGKHLAGGFDRSADRAAPPIASSCCNSRIWIRSRRSTKNKSRSRRTLAANMPASASWPSKPPSRNKYRAAGRLRARGRGRLYFYERRPRRDGHAQAEIRPSNEDAATAPISGQSPINRSAPSPTSMRRSSSTRATRPRSTIAPTPSSTPATSRARLLTTARQWRFAPASRKPPICSRSLA